MLDLFVKTYKKYLNIPRRRGFASSSCFSSFLAASMARIFIGGGIRLPFRFFGNVNIAIEAKIINEEIRTKPKYEKGIFC